jgi:hypothetical protein
MHVACPKLHSCQSFTISLREKYIGFWWKNLKEMCHLKDVSIDKRITSKRILWKYNGRHGCCSSGSGCGKVVGSCEDGNEPSGSLKCKEFLD